LPRSRLEGLLHLAPGEKKYVMIVANWQQIEAYIRDHSEADFSHGICPACAQKLVKSQGLLSGNDGKGQVTDGVLALL